MDEMIWIEVLPRHREHAQRLRITGESITLGRAWDNDIVLEDPHVAAHHLRIARGADGAWLAEDLGSVNGLYVDGERQRREKATFAAGTTLRIGHSLLRLHPASEVVPPELLLARGRSPWPGALACLALVLLIALLDLWRGETGEPKLIRYLTAVLAVATIVALWTSAWAVVSRIFDGHARFGTHLLIGCGGLLAYSLYDPLSELGAFAFSWQGLARYAYVGAWLLLGATCFAHLRLLGRKRLPLKALAVCALAALGITTQTLKQTDWRANYGQPAMLQRLEPPSLRLVGAQDLDAFLAGSAMLKAKIDAARSEAPVGDDTATSDD
jgi:hypothetical protein